MPLWDVQLNLGSLVVSPFNNIILIRDYLSVILNSVLVVGLEDKILTAITGAAFLVQVWPAVDNQQLVLPRGQAGIVEWPTSSIQTASWSLSAGVSLFLMLLLGVASLRHALNYSCSTTDLCYDNSWCLGIRAVSTYKFKGLETYFLTHSDRTGTSCAGWPCGLVPTGLARLGFMVLWQVISVHLNSFRFFSKNC